MTRTPWLAVCTLAMAAACSFEAPPPSSAEVLAEALATAGPGERPGPRPVDPSAVSLPATFTGLLPCDGCPGVRYHLNLLRDGSFHLRRVNLGSDNGTVEDRGAWGLGADRRTLTLTGPRLSGMRFFIVDDHTLRQFETPGDPSETNGSHELVRSDRFDPLTTMSAAAPRAETARTFADRRWMLTHLGATSSTGGAYLEFLPDSRSFGGSDGCNRLAGSYLQSGSRMSFEVSVVTRLECPDGAPAPIDLAAALRRTHTWAIVDARLELRDADGAVIAQFR
jgi:heat shock protein HslJ